MMKASALDIPTTKIAEVDIALEEDSFSAHEQSLQLPTVKTEQSKTGRITEGHRTISGEYNNFQDKTLSGHQLQHSASASLSGRLETQQMISSLNKLTIEQVSQYFQNNSKVLSSTEEQFENFVENISEQIKNRIEEGLLIVSKHQKHLEFNKPPKRVDQEKLRQNLLYKRQEIIEQLKQISQEEINIRSLKRSLSHRGKERYEITEQDKRKLIQLVKAKKEFEFSLKKKNDQLLQDSKNARAQEQARLKKEYETANKSKKDKILTHLKQIEIKSKEREEQLKHSVLRKVSGYAYKKNERQWKRSQSVHELQIKKKIEQIREKHNLKIEEINQHEKKYSLQLENRVLTQSKVKLTSQSLPKRKKTHFDRIIEEELFQLKEKHKEQALKIFQKDYREKIVRFQEKIDQDYKPIVDPTKTIVKYIEKSYSSISLSKEERVEKGLEYLAKAKQMKKNIINISSVNPEATENSKGSKVHSEESTGYTNYLKQNVPYNPLKRELSEILSEKEQKRSFQSLLRAKYLTEGLQAKAKRGGDNQMYNSMKSKLKLLQNLY